MSESRCAARVCPECGMLAHADRCGVCRDQPLLMTESEVRALRDAVYGVPTTDGNWEACKENWMRPGSIAFLREHAALISVCPPGAGGGR